MVSIYFQFNKEVGIFKNEYKTGMLADPDKQEMDDIKLEDEMGCHWKIFFQKNEVGIYGKKELLHCRVVPAPDEKIYLVAITITC